MKTKVIRDASGAIINIGPWDHKMEPVMVDDLTKPIFASDWATIKGYAQKPIGEHASNPLPEGAYEDETEVVTSEDGGLCAVEDHRALRQAAYPRIGDQLDALFKAGVFPADMTAQIAAVKAKYPKSSG